MAQYYNLQPGDLEYIKTPDKKNEDYFVCTEKNFANENLQKEVYKTCCSPWKRTLYGKRNWQCHELEEKNQNFKSFEKKSECADPLDENFQKKCCSSWKKKIFPGRKYVCDQSKNYLLSKNTPLEEKLYNSLITTHKMRDKSNEFNKLLAREILEKNPKVADLEQLQKIREDYYKNFIQTHTKEFPENEPNDDAVSAAGVDHNVLNEGNDRVSPYTTQPLIYYPQRKSIIEQNRRRDSITNPISGKRKLRETISKADVLKAAEKYVKNPESNKFEEKLKALVYDNPLEGYNSKQNTDIALKIIKKYPEIDDIEELIQLRENDDLLFMDPQSAGKTRRRKMKQKKKRSTRRKKRRSSRRR